MGKMINISSYLDWINTIRSIIISYEKLKKELPDNMLGFQLRDDELSNLRYHLNLGLEKSFKIPKNIFNISNDPKILKQLKKHQILLISKTERLY